MKKSILYMIKKIIIGVGIILVLGFFNSCEVHAKTEVQGVQAVPTSYNLVVDDAVMNYYISNNNFHTYYTNLLPPYNIPFNAFTFIDLGIPNIPTNEKWSYFYIAGFSNQPVIATSSNVLCESLSASSLSNKSSDVQSLTPFSFRCISSGQSTIWLRLFPQTNNNAIINNTGTFQWRVLINKNAYVSTDATNNVETQLSQQNDLIQQQVDTQNEVKDFLKDSSTPTNSDVNNVISGATTDNATVSDLVNLIPNTLQVIINGLNSGCTGGYNLGSLFGTELILPCINPVDYLGSFLWGVIDSILCLCYLIPFSKWLVNTYNDLTSLKNRRLM